MITQDEFNDAIGRVSSADWKDGKPKMKALNAVLKDMGLEQIKASERDAMWEAGLMDVVGPMEAPPAEPPRVTIVFAHVDPIPLYVHGVGSFTLKVGETYSLPEAAVSALRNANVTLKET